MGEPGFEPRQFISRASALHPKLYEFDEVFQRAHSLEKKKTFEHEEIM